MRVLIIDDDDVIVDVIKDSVHWEKLGIQDVLTAYDANSARKFFQQYEIDLVVSDIEMPKESGLELLQWYREQGYSGKYILLTSYESFNYARKALELRASDYMLKPFNVEAMELVLKKNLDLLQKERKSTQEAVLGQWVSRHMEELRLNFLESLLNGRISCDKETIENNIRIRNLRLSMETDYCLIATNATGVEADLDQYGSDSLQYMMKNLHAEYLPGVSSPGQILCYERADSFLLLAVCEPLPEEELLELCGRMQKKSRELLESTFTTCIGNPCKLTGLRKAYQKVSDCMEKNVMAYGQAFSVESVRAENDDIVSVFDTRNLTLFMNDRQQKKIMDYLKQELDNRVRQKRLDEKTIRVAQLEFRQTVYAYLTERGILASRLFQDTVSVSMTQKSDRSVIDFLRWANFLITQAFGAVEELQKQQDLIPQIDRYIREHYQEKIGRNEIGQHFHMVPEYLAKVYKRKTGKTIKDAINDCRIEQAKRLLKETSRKVIDIAMETGFDNISYFSTLFKKSTGLTPNDYRNK